MLMLKNIKKIKIGEFENGKQNSKPKTGDALGFRLSPDSRENCKNRRIFAEYKGASAKKPLLPAFNASQKRTDPDADS
jgi:hypothetical protein